MKCLIRGCFAIAIIIVTCVPRLSAADAISYVVLEDGDPGALVRISADGRTVSTIARDVSGLGLTVDGARNYIVAGKTGLLRITPAGSISTIASAPAGSVWASVVIDGAGNFLVGDGIKPALWRVSADGKTTTKLLTFDDIDTVGGYYRQSALVSDRAGDCFFLVEGYNHRVGIIPQLFRITPQGQTTEIPLSGVRFRRASGMVPLANGDLLISIFQGRQFLRVTDNGVVTLFADLDSRDWYYPGGFALRPDDGSIVVLLPIGNEVARLNADGSPTKDSRIHLPLTPTGIVVESSR